VPDRTVNRGESRSLTDSQARRLTCVPADHRARTRSLPSWSCGFDYRRPLQCSGPSSGRDSSIRHCLCYAVVSAPGH
jgi:hypothetical protein